MSIVSVRDGEKFYGVGGEVGNEVGDILVRI